MMTMMTQDDKEIYDDDDICIFVQKRSILTNVMQFPVIT